MINPELDCVFIETTTACTRRCKWCTHRYYDIKPYFMTETLFLKVMSELGEIGFSGRLSFYLNGEPLLDRRLYNWISIGKKLCPKSFTFIITNGDLLTENRSIELLNAGLDAIKVNTYDNKTFIKVNETIQRLPALLSKRILHLDASKRTYWTSRGGTVPVSGRQADVVQIDEGVCLRPFRQLYITVKGLVAQCCSDALNRYIMGDINTDSLLDIWNGERFRKVRDSLIGKEPLNGLCRVCDLERAYQEVDEVRQLFENR
jgi:MoaA/NifB/PqqE/SkfB family radical SAM enzyme